MKTSKIKFLFFLVVLGIVLYYWGQPHPFQQFKHDVSNIFNGKNEKKKEPWTREGREDNVASDTKENDTEATDNEASDTKSSSKKDNSIVDILKDAVEEGTKTLPNIKDEVFKDNSSSNVVFKTSTNTNLTLRKTRKLYDILVIC
jgi:endonuclease G